MPTRRLLASLPLAFGALACTAILGDFSKGPPAGTEGGAGESGPGDASGDVSVNDSGGSSDARASDGPTAIDSAVDSADSAGESGIVLRRLRCSDSGPSGRIDLTMGSSLNPDAIRIANLPGGLVRVVVADYPVVDGSPSSTAVLRSYTYDQNNSSTGIATVFFPTNTGQVFALDRYAAGPNGPGGFVAIYPGYVPMKMQTAILAARLPDNGNAWVGPTAVAAIPNIAGNSEAALLAVDGAADDYYVAFSSVTGATQTVLAGRANPSVPMLPVATTYGALGPGQSAYNLVSPGIAMTPLQAYILLSPNGQNGPPALGSPAAMLLPGAATPTVLYKPPSNLNYFPLAFAGATDPSKANIAIFVADLTQLQGDYRVGQVSVSSLATLDVMTLPDTMASAPDGGAASFRDLLINNTTAHVETAGGAEQLLVAAPPLNLNGAYPGLNLAWWDGATGAIRAFAAGGGALFTDVASVHRADATFASLVGSIAQMWVVYENSKPAMSMNNFPPPQGNVWLARVNCSL
jgi:hypothetical protein